MMNRSLLFSLFLSSTALLQGILGQGVPELFNGEDPCPLNPLCCEEDCCGPSSSWSTTLGRCIADINSTGWAGQHSDIYTMGCAERACCLDDCCAPGTTFVDGWCVPLGSISGNVKSDENNDNVGDVNLAGTPISLVDVDTSTVLGTTITNSDGDYTFFDVPPGTYQVIENNLDGFPFDVSDTDGGPNFNTIQVTLGPSTGSLNSTNNDFVDEPPRFISGVVLEDLDNDDLGEIPIPNVPVALRAQPGDILIATTLTDSNGFFEFGPVPPGQYSVVQTNLPPFTDVSDTDTPANATGYNGTDYMHMTNVTGGDNSTMSAMGTSTDPDSGMVEHTVNVTVVGSDGVLSGSIP